jgi:transcriptional regulator with XRE-family HTH domain
MTAEELYQLRRRLRLTQTQMAAAMGVAFRSYQELENEDRSIRRVHEVAAERAALARAAELHDPMLAPANVRRDALALYHDLVGTTAVND